ncbi:MAG: polyprenyl synthetase family protein [Chloroflexia bacterium]|nr:polyprenyl synthetase family protein [Chloroflexia bacterium]
MANDLDLVDQRIITAAAIDFPIVSGLIQDIVKSGGKRMRPLLLLLAARSYDYDLERAVTAAAGIELLHTASLVHDDSIDRAALRRGQPTLNSQLDPGAVILIGDFLFAQSAVLAAATNEVRVVAIFARSLAEICDGQIRETLDANRLDQDLADYDRRIHGKTAALFAGAAEMGAVIGGAPERDVMNLKEFGKDLGMAFQIQDDILDLREGTQKLGKPAGNDIRQGVVTLPTMIYAERASEETRTILEGILVGDITDDVTIDDVVARIRVSGALDAAEDRAMEFVDSARARLAAIADTETRGFLDDLLHQVINRSA